MLKAAVVGATGYTGEELVKILLAHPEVEITSLTAKIDKPIALNELFPSFKGKTDLVCEDYDFDRAAKDADVVFLAVPHSVAMELAPAFLEKGKVVIDLSADFRLKDPSLYPAHYNFTHSAPKLLAKAVYGLPELYRSEIKKADLIANPGCFPTAVILGLLPLAKKNILGGGTILVDAKTGVSGAGRKASVDLIFPEVSENIKAYKVGRHQHEIEMIEILGEAAGGKVNLIFVPHLIPVQRGILATMYVTVKDGKTERDLWGLYRDFYRDEPFVNVLELDHFPETKFVRAGNDCHIGLRTKGKTAIIVAAVDNLRKGAAGQAAQNMNIRFGFAEDTGLKNN